MRNISGFGPQTALLRKGLLPSSPGIVEHHDRRIECVRVEWPAEPLPHLLVIRVLRIADGKEELLIATDAAAVLGRASACTIDAPRIALWCKRRGDLGARLSASPPRVTRLRRLLVPACQHAGLARWFRR